MPGPATVSAVPAELDTYARALADPPPAVRVALGAAEQALARWSAAGGGGVAAVDLGTALAALRAAIGELAQLDGAVAQVAAAFRLADHRSRPPGGLVTVSAARWSTAWRDLARGGRRPPVGVRRPGGPRTTRVVQVALDELGPGASAQGWDEVVSRALPAERTGPVHMVIHGWGATSHDAGRAGEATGSLHDARGAIGATVIVIDWPAGEGTAAPALGIWRDFAEARRRAGESGTALAGLLDAVARARPGSPISVSAHSLGVAVAAAAVEGAREPAGRLRIDLLAIQGAAPVTGPEGDRLLGALADPRIGRLMVTTNDADRSLGLYEVVGPEALGDEPPQSEVLAELAARRRAAGAVTRIVAHDDPDGRGHLHLSPTDRHPLVRDLTEELISGAS